ncbi:hypothetical protein GIB67_004045 [Kingdonia uniflora]|uniref:Disease resistance protein n=1 Tax=Kingdonia uniflora TaxID=39325 RepID=A0A7J7NRD0_9MAGN|nr:hypothetical protein GIB67_004045 [Kingdonia uniflora]
MEGAAIAVTPVTELVKCAAVPIARYISYVTPTAAQNAWDHIFYYETYVNDLQSKVQEDLQRLEHDVIEKVNLARDNGDEIQEVVQNWLKMVINVRDKATQLYNEAGAINSCFQGWGSASHRIGKESKEKIVIVDKLLIEGRSFSSVSNPAPVPPRVAEDFDAFASREATKKKVIQALMDDKTNLVGVYGMGGVGKTTLMKEIRKQVEETELFDKVVFATVSQNPDLRGIQTQITESLGMKIEEHHIPARAAKLSARLKQEKNILLMLDDLWTRLKLTDVGIILGGVGENICKVIITSRSLYVCNSMGTTENIKVEVLSKKDSLELFRKEVGDIDFDAQREMSEKIVNECDGLPLAIVTLARALRKKDKHVWAGVVPQLKKSMYGGMSSVIASVKLSYDFLETSETKLCFLLCALFPEDHEVTMDALIGYAMGENLLGDVETFREARGNLYLIVDTLICSGLLLNGRDLGFGLKNKDFQYVMMHDIIRDVAISIARENRNESIISVGLGLQKWPELKDSGKCLRMSLMSNYFNEVPVTLECSKFVILSLASNRSLMAIPDGFFKGMKCLATLDLSNIGIRYLPQSLSCLNNCLGSLYLDNCNKLRDISLIGNLKALKILSLEGTIGIKRLPQEISGLTNLKMLDLSYNQNLKSIPPKLISSLSSLEELYMIGSFSMWEIEGTRYNASLREVASLTNLTSLCLEIKNAKWLSTDIRPCQHWEKLENLGTAVGINTIGISKSERCVSLTTTSDSFPVAAWVNILMGRTSELYLDSCEGLENVLQLNPKGFNNLKVLQISFCHELVNVLPSLLQNLEEIEIVNCRKLEKVFEDGPASILKLRSIKLYGLYSLTSIWKGAVPLIRLESLKILFVENCRNLRSRHLFPSVAFAQRFQQLEVLKVSSFPQFTKLIAEETEEMEIKSCPINFNALPPQPPIFSNLKKLEIKYCHGLKCIFPIGILRGLLQLEELEVSSCNEMENLFEFEECQKEEVQLPRLRLLQLWRLPRLSSFFCHQRRFPRVLLDCPSLEKLTINYCLNLKRLPFGPQSIPKLKKFYIKYDEEWFDIEYNEEWFERLECEDPSVKSKLQQLL